MKLGLWRNVYDMIGEPFDNGNHNLLDASKNDADHNRTQLIIFDYITVKIDWHWFSTEEDIDNFFPEQLKK